MSDRATETKLILVKRRTRLDELAWRHNTEEQARFYIESRGEDFDVYIHEDQSYRASLVAVETTLSRIGRVQTLDRDFLSNFIFGAQDVVVVLGQDGLVANTLKYLHGQPVVAVNPDPARIDGVLLPFQVADLDAVLRELLKAKRPIKRVSMAEASLNDGQTMVAVNDFFIGPKNHTSLRYEIDFREASEMHSSSGVIVSTGLGSTGWMRSVIAGSLGLARARGAQGDSADAYQPLSWDAQKLLFSVREPFPSNTTQTELVFGEITGGEALTIKSRVPENGVIFSDGMIGDAIEFNSGAVVNISLSQRYGSIVH
ncbi:sugar kinase [Hahella sp. HN01]|uniref:sugar kinase n=1 Tax=Hahella sp. HN01 TaxID=2847262 RepID=UPI001C1F0041|nr:sugar kinase [Hahella sp. HN01]MBU6954978.1 sugar kinase [Hahella sp. HN01]